jgi:hypothetical protein
MKFLGNTSSGSQGGETYSHNRFGQYVRRRAVPVQPRTAAQLAVRSRMANNAAGWRLLTDAQRAAWESLGTQITRTDAVGKTYTFNGFMTYCSVNNNREAAGDATVSAPPALVTPPTIATATLTLTSASFSLAYTATPLATGVRLFVFASPQQSAGRSFNGNYRLIAVTAAAAASPAVVLTAYSAVFGAPVTGMRIFLSLQTYEAGFLNTPFLLNQVVA